MADGAAKTMEKPGDTIEVKGTVIGVNFRPGVPPFPLKRTATIGVPREVAAGAGRLSGWDVDHLEVESETLQLGESVIVHVRREKS